MLTFLKGDILKCDAQALVVPVNCVGVAGAGLALAVKKQYPEWFVAYRTACDVLMLTPETLSVYRRPERLNIGPPDPEYIISFPTKDHWKNDSNATMIGILLGKLAFQIVSIGIVTLAMPALGCGRGNLPWAEIKPLIETFASYLPNCNILCYEPLP